MTLDELIAILQPFDPAAVVVVSTYDDRGDAHNVHELQGNDLRAVAMRPVTPMHQWFDHPRAQLYEVEESGSVAGLEVGCNK